MKSRLAVLNLRINLRYSTQFNLFIYLNYNLKNGNLDLQYCQFYEKVSNLTEWNIVETKKICKNILN